MKWKVIENILPTVRINVSLHIAYITRYKSDVRNGGFSLYITAHSMFKFFV